MLSVKARGHTLGGGSTLLSGGRGGSRGKIFKKFLQFHEFLKAIFNPQYLISLAKTLSFPQKQVINTI